MLTFIPIFAWLWIFGYQCLYHFLISCSCCFSALQHSLLSFVHSLSLKCFIVGFVYFAVHVSCNAQFIIPRIWCSPVIAVFKWHGKAFRWGSLRQGPPYALTQYLYLMPYHAVCDLQLYCVSSVLSFAFCFCFFNYLKFVLLFVSFILSHTFPPPPFFFCIVLGPDFVFHLIVLLPTALVLMCCNSNG